MFNTLIFMKIHFGIFSEQESLLYLLNGDLFQCIVNFLFGTV